LYQIILFIPLLLIIAIGFYLSKNRGFRKDPSDPMDLPPPVTMQTGNDSVLLACMNLKNIYLMMGSILWCITIFFTLMVVSEIRNQPVAVQARGVIDFITTQESWKYSPIVFIVIMLYLLYSRTKITWDNGLIIADKPADILYFEVKKITATAYFIYLQSKDRLWILVPATSEEMKKFKNIKVLNRELAFNETQIQQLKHNLRQSGVQEKKFSLVTKYLIFGLVAFLTLAIFVIIMFA
jgi:hypothetical protein